VVMVAQIDCLALPRRERASAMLYRLEEQLPVSIENLTADFLPPIGGRALGVAVQTDRVQELTVPLAEAGVEVAAICPTALLALWQVSRAPEDADYVVMASAGRIDMFRLYEKRPAAWYAVADDPGELVQWLKADHLVHPVQGQQATVCVMAEATWSTSPLETEVGLRIVCREEESALGLAARAAGSLLAEGEAGWIDLCQGALSPHGAWGRLSGLVRSAAVFAMILPAVLAAVFYWRGLEYADRKAEAMRGQAAAYHEALPNRPVPQAVKSRLRSERARLAGLSGMSAAIPPQASALESLRTVMASIPASMRIRVSDIRIGPDGILLDGQVRAHTDAEIIGRSLAAAGFAVEPPFTESLATGGVGFTLSGRPVTAGVVPHEKWETQ